MARSKKTAESDQAVDEHARLITSKEDRAKAAKWFARARDLGEKRQFDYAIEYYINGLEFWPDAVEEGCRPLHGCAVARRQTGGKKPGLMDTMKRSMTDKKPKQALLNALWLFGHEPENPGYIDGVVQSANRLRAEEATHWAGGVYLKALDSAPKTGAKQFNQLAGVAEQLGDRAGGRGDTTFGIAAYQMGLDALTAWRRRAPQDKAVVDALRHLSTKLTILKGRYQGSSSYRESLVDSEQQRELHDEQRSVQSEERLEELIAKAQREFEEDPDEGRHLKSLVDLLCRRERDDEESRAIGILVTEYKRTENYRWKQLADDIRMKQLGRRTREVAQNGDEAAIKEHRVSQLKFELAVFKERVDRYPTDARIKFQYGVRNFLAGRFDEAIPLLQMARTDPKNRAICGMYLGRCFFRKGYHSQAIATLEEAIGGHEISDDEVAKTMLYWLGRTQEAGGLMVDAKKTYGKILQMDYNYQDVRARMDAMPA